MILTHAMPRSGSHWTDNGKPRERRALKHRPDRPAEFQLHLRGALTNGCTIEEIRETLIQLAVYAGIPAGVEAFRLARQVLAEYSGGKAQAAGTSS